MACMVGWYKMMAYMVDKTWLDTWLNTRLPLRGGIPGYDIAI